MKVKAIGHGEGSSPSLRWSVATQEAAACAILCARAVAPAAPAAAAPAPAAAWLLLLRLLKLKRFLVRFRSTKLVGSVG